MRYWKPLFFITLATFYGCNIKRLEEGSRVLIADGEVVTSDDPLADSTVALVDSANGFLCSGVLIAPRLVLSAAHCANPQKIRFGVAEEDGSDNFNYLEVGQTHQHKCYASRDRIGDKFGFDLKLIWLNEEVPEEYGRPIELLESQESLINQTTWAVGYGATGVGEWNDGRILRKAQFVVKTDNRYSEKAIHMVGGPGRVYGRSLCHGDSGGPTFIKRNEEWLLLGINSHAVGDQSGICEDGSAIVDIRGHLNWVQAAKNGVEALAQYQRETEDICVHQTNDDHALKPFNDGLRGHGKCRITMDLDPAQVFIRDPQMSYGPECNAGAMAYAPTQYLLGFRVSTPAEVSEVVLCKIDETTESCVGNENAPRIPIDAINAGEGRNCFSFESSERDRGTTVNIVYMEGETWRRSSLPIKIDFLPCTTEGI